MTVNTDYMPQSEDEFTAWLDNFAVKLPEHQAALVLTTSELDQVTEDAETVRLVISGSELLKTSMSEYVNYKRIMLSGGANDPTPTFPVINAPAAPDKSKAGIRERTRALVRRIKTASGYNDSIGGDLGILAAQSGERAPGDLKPVLKVKVAPEAQIEISFVRGKTNGISLEMQRGDETAWTKLGNFGQSPAVVTVAPVVPGTPEKVRLRARYLDGNTPIGQFSDTANVVTEP